jgi:hypothetical protein
MDPDPDPAIFVLEIQNAQKKYFFNSFSAAEINHPRNAA